MRGSAVALLLLAATGPLASGGEARRLVRSDWHLKYEPLESAEATSLLDGALAFGRRRLGEPALPVRKVQLRRSVPREAGAQLRSGFQLTEITDSAEGIFTIYLSARPGDVAFPGQLAHEAFHLFNAQLRDVYVEGLNCLLAEEFLAGRGISWEPWLRHFREGRDPLYAAAYALARDLSEAAGRGRWAASSGSRWRRPAPGNGWRSTSTGGSPRWAGAPARAPGRPSPDASRRRTTSGGGSSPTSPSGGRRGPDPPRPSTGSLRASQRTGVPFSASGE